MAKSSTVERDRGSREKRRLSFPRRLIPLVASTGARAGVDTLDRILSGAEDVFRSQGFLFSRVEDVLEKAGVSRRTFYQYFTSKDAVAEAVLSRSVSVLLAAMRARLALARSPRGKVAAGIDVYLELWQRHGAVVRDLFAESLRADSQLFAARRKALKGVVAYVRDELERDGREIDPLKVELLLLGTESMVLHRVPLGGALSKDDAEKIKSAIEPLFHRVLLGEA